MVSMLKKIGKEWTRKEEGGMFTADHLSPTQLNKNIDQWFYDYCKLTAAERKKLKPRRVSMDPSLYRPMVALRTLGEQVH